MISYLDSETQGKKGGLNSFSQPLEPPVIAKASVGAQGYGATRRRDKPIPWFYANPKDPRKRDFPRSRDVPLPPRPRGFRIEDESSFYSEQQERVVAAVLRTAFRGQVQRTRGVLLRSTATTRKSPDSVIPSLMKHENIGLTRMALS